CALAGVFLAKRALPQQDSQTDPVDQTQEQSSTAQVTHVGMGGTGREPFFYEREQSHMVTVSYITHAYDPKAKNHPYEAERKVKEKLNQ
ncbi:MAG: hypothetical protein AAFS10_22810, partial [Myxococcota bacterium]